MLRGVKEKEAEPFFVIGDLRTFGKSQAKRKQELGRGTKIWVLCKGGG